MKPPAETKAQLAFFLQRDGLPIRFVLGRDCLCSSLNLATFFPDRLTAEMACAAHCDERTRVMGCAMQIVKLTKTTP
jgi:hypothetical protein